MEKALREKLTGGNFENVTVTDSKRMSAVKGRGNKTTELIYRLMLVRAGVKGWKIHPKGIVGKPDFFFPVERIAVFVDGCFWHGCSRCGHVPKVNSSFWAAKFERNRQRDAENVAKLQAEGIQSIRIWEHEIRESPGLCIARLLGLLLPRGEPPGVDITDPG